MEVINDNIKSQDNNVGITLQHKITKNKNKVFKKEQKEILDKLLNILEINSENKLISIINIDNDENKQKDILNLLDDIEIYFCTSNWAIIKNKNLDKKYVSLIKSVLKYMNIEYETIKCSSYINDKIVNYCIYKITSDI